jgi:hypothetical protein
MPTTAASSLRALERAPVTDNDSTTSFLARREDEDVLNRSDRRRASSTNPWWRSIGNGHAMGMEPRRAVRIWVRTDMRIARSVQQGRL